MMKLNASEDFKEKHPTHRGIPGGNQVDGLPPELRDSDKIAFSRASVNQFFCVQYLVHDVKCVRIL